MVLSKADRDLIEDLPWRVISDCAANYAVRPEYIAACILVESSGDSWAMRFEPGWKYFLSAAKIKLSATANKTSQATEKNGQAISWGLMQIMGSVAREKGFMGPFTQLTVPTFGVGYGTLHLKSQLRRYGGNIYDAISSYNAGSSQRVGQSQKFKNQAHLDRFSDWLEKVLVIMPVAMQDLAREEIKAPVQS